MLIREVSRLTGLTRKAIEYYISQNLVAPVIRENGYRDFSGHDVETLQKIHTLRRLSLSVEQIRAILADSGRSSLQAASVRAALNIQQAQRQQALLEQLAAGACFADIRTELDVLENQRAVIDRLTDAFPGYLGQFLALHFAPYLNMPIDTAEQKAAYCEILGFLDDMPPLPEDICRWIDEMTACMSAEQMTAADRAVRDMVNEPDRFAERMKNALPHAGAFRASEPGRRMQAIKQLFSRNGYYDVFIPALRRLSPSYDVYSRKLAALDAKLNMNR